ncbi:TFIIH basal transcription factor complex p47 subunit [Diplogelasinospora grovesii]|uniref:General transcription and DNA repair factor IIH n=1 Tax=Diplogelasinospora grovesii TaxID=303347 RepID=A0AAN6NCY3_9PEZI|nr:TFIIH basal transcription factor complex p47 subunit [Diplogelasinospora grovesii]
MADSDGEYVEDMSDDELGSGAGENNNNNNNNSSSYGTRSKDPNGARGDRQRGRDKAKNNARNRAAWEDIQRSWEAVAETADGTISIGELLEAEKRRRLLRDTTPLQRGIIRHLMLVLDMSFAMAEKDLLPSRYLCTINYAVDFVREYFEQNPISQLGIIGMRDGIAVRISDMSGNPAEHIERLREWGEQQEPQGNPSLQNALEMCRGALFHAPSHGTREVLIIYGALLSSDPGDINDTISHLIADRIRVSIVGLSGHLAICAELCSRTNGGDDGNYRIAMHEQHLRELFLAATTPPATLSTTAEQNKASLLMMGFPSRTLAGAASGKSKEHSISLCACHNKPSRQGYACTRCRAKVCRLPAECPACGLTLILSTHLARSYHHLFPLKNWVEVPWAEAKKSTACYSCLSPFPPIPPKPTRIIIKGAKPSNAPGVPSVSKAPVPPEAVVKGVSESGRYACQVCGNHFCIDCDVFAHEVIHNCPGCQSDTRVATLQEAAVDGAVNGQGNNGVVDANGGMIIDS